ncbi:PBP1A family penicillin-binding protein [Fulvivirga sp. M361]|uniref:penicillin-binding protein 1A n=1 Tax=Fulvivirga sp. M361 TaxID=2594266 RepID=UPI00117AAFD6|nr:PBP1A family penicillin-binding protein [Fulvivirga sp. M361]TRX52038.1 PBP1A family penicillin-binding protein [Fulvivirga sp. M361]
MKGVLGKAFKLLLKLVVILAAMGVAFILLVAGGLFGELPSEEQLKNIQNNLSTEIYSADGKIIGKFHIQERTSVDFEDISKHAIDALVATEDTRFYSHHGIDYRSLVRVLIKTVILQDRSGGGGSTISQQLVKNIFPREQNSIWTIPVIKVKESLLAHRLENVYAKKDILTLYLNTVPFGENIYGIETAAKRFFNKSAKKLTLEEAAVLIGMLKANYTYNPRLFPEKSLARRNVVLAQMHKYLFIDDKALQQTQQRPLIIDYQKKKSRRQLAAYFRQKVRKELEAWIKVNPKPDGSRYNIYTDGLKVHTTLDSRLQSHAEQAVREHMTSLQSAFETHWKNRNPWDDDPAILQSALNKHPGYQKMKGAGLSQKEIMKELDKKHPTSLFSWKNITEKELSSLDSIKHYLNLLHAGVVAMDPKNGDVLAWVGGIDFDYFQYDHADERTKRQVGSTFKPFVYAAALENGSDPCKHVSAARTVYTNMKDWTPDNADRKENTLKYSFKGALAQSVNTVTVKIMEETGLSETISLARESGITSTIPEVPSVALGTPSISLLEMTRAYSVFANNGAYSDSRIITSITDQSGNVLAEFKNDTPKRVLSEGTAMMINAMLQEVVNSGTASRARRTYHLKNALAGKTGTTQSNADGWFIGYNPALVVGVWVGADDPRVRFRSTGLGSGANMALPIFARMFQKINSDRGLSNISKARFTPLPASLARKLDCVNSKEDKNFLQNLLGIEKKEKVKKKEFGEKKKGFFDKIGSIFKKKKKDE